MRIERAKLVLIFILSISFPLFFTSCQSDEVKNVPDVSKVGIDLKIIRLENAVSDLAKDTLHFKEKYEALYKKHPQILDAYTKFVLHLPDSNMLKGFVCDSFMRTVFDTTQKAFSDIKDIEKSLKKSFQFYKYYFPNKPIPTIYTGVSAFNYGVLVLNDSSIFIGLDMFLGDKYRPYYLMETPLYRIRTMNRNHLPSMIMRALADNSLQQQSIGTKMVDRILYNGKVFYLLDNFMPYTADSLKFAMPEIQLAYCKISEGQLYRFLAKQDLLYSNKQEAFRAFVNEGPFDIDRPTERPGNSASWLGYRIIQQYMNSMKLTDMKVLLAETDVQKIIGKYKAPKK